ncbi:MAG: triose-phosphate isomerase [Cyclobacteriaceae bacterium]
MRKQIVAGNWKMNTNLNEGKKLASEVINMVETEVRNNAEVILIPPFIHLTGIHSLIGSANIFLGAQNCHQNESGAYTGEVSAAMLKAADITHVIIGHSERREYFKEFDALLAEKINQVLKNEMTPIFCCGERLESREAGTQETVVEEQVQGALFHLSKEEIAKVVIAYEPVWAIGTGKTASAEQAQEMHAFIRAILTEKYSSEVADNISILYGGSVKPDNAKELFSQPDVDGGLIGGASLKSRDFTDIIKAFD